MPAPSESINFTQKGLMDGFKVACLFFNPPPSPKLCFPANLLYIADLWPISLFLVPCVLFSWKPQEAVWVHVQAFQWQHPQTSRAAPFLPSFSFQLRKQLFSFCFFTFSKIKSIFSISRVNLRRLICLALSPLGLTVCIVAGCGCLTEWQAMAPPRPLRAPKRHIPALCPCLLCCVVFLIWRFKTDLRLPMSHFCPSFNKNVFVFVLSCLPLHVSEAHVITGN